MWVANPGQDVARIGAARHEDSPVPAQPHEGSLRALPAPFVLAGTYDDTSAPQQALAPPSAASVICCRCLAQLATFFLRPIFFLGRAPWCGDASERLFRLTNHYSSSPSAHRGFGRLLVFLHDFARFLLGVHRFAPWCWGGASR